MPYQLRFYNDNMPPVLSNGFQDIRVDNYIIGAPNDPHWKLYPKNQFLSARNMYPIGYAFTDYVADANHYIFYIPDNTGPTLDYSRKLRDHFETIHKYRQQYKKEELEKLSQEKREKALQIKKILAEQKKKLKMYTEEISKLSSIRDRAIRKAVRSGATKNEAQELYDRENQMYVNTVGSIIVLKSNISNLQNELKNYID
tara:strand:+ start:5473 stop:6072 length:600 start_codon:yes stop_codon:yes gene_type:complete